MRGKWFVILAAVVGFNLLQPHAVSADSIFDIKVDTSLFSGATGFSFQFTDGDPAGAHNSATITNFLLSGGGLEGDAITDGDVTGDLASGLRLGDVGTFSSYFGQQFGSTVSTLSFRLRLTTLADAGAGPDGFAFSLLDSNWIEVPTGDPLGTNTLLTFYLMSNGPELGYSGVSLTPVDTTPVPEPGTLALMGTALVAAAGRRLHRRRSARRV